MEYLKKLLGEKFKEEITLDELSQTFSEMNIGLPQDMSKYIEKTKYDTLSSEIAEYKRKERENLSETEKKELAFQEKLAELESQNQVFLKEKQVSEYTSKFLGLGYDQELAKETAFALSENDMNKVFECQERFKTGLEKKLNIQNLNDLGKPGVDNKNKAMNKEAFDKLNATEQMNFAKENPELATKFMSTK